MKYPTPWKFVPYDSSEAKGYEPSDQIQDANGTVIFDCVEGWPAGVAKFIIKCVNASKDSK